MYAPGQRHNPSRHMNRTRVPVAVSAVVVTVSLGLAACAPSPGVDVAADASPAQARVIATTDFGASVLFDVVVALSPETTAMDALAQVAEVDTSYGGGFVEGINGVGTGISGKSARLDWFYSINGFTARTGAAGYVLHDGDSEHWDYRDWSFRRNVSATLGAFPDAFVHGYRGNVKGSVVAHGPEFTDEAETLASVLAEAGASHVRTVALEGVSGDLLENNNVVIVASRAADLVQQVSDNWARLGLFACFEGEALRVYSADGEEEVRADSTGIILAMQNPWNSSGTGACENVAVIVSGCDEAAVQDASALLSTAYPELVHVTGVVVQGESWAALP